MELKLTRTKFLKTHTVGQLYIDGDFFCFTLEDVVREIKDQPVEKWKIKNETAIPKGRYKVTLVNSPKFGPDTPSLSNVPGFSYIRIHAGNTDKHTEGCLLLGYKLNDANIIQPGTTRPAVADLKVKLKATKEEVWITIE
jgi:hypothetical protein